MTEISLDKVAVSTRPGLGQAVLYRLVVIAMFWFAAVAVIVRRMGGGKSDASIWQETREAAYAVAGYAFKY